MRREVRGIFFSLGFTKYDFQIYDDVLSTSDPWKNDQADPGDEDD